ncbi:hypothetical protein LP414_02175 [Polaromonas sp. P1(28)-13]|nr:hypothetical protein LP414_02175 [Polaromonas sp. P1(28)-13]
MEIEFARMGIVYLHLIACCVAIGLVLTSDIAMVKQLLKADPADRLDSKHLSGLQTTVSRALVVLWITGVAIISLDASIKGWGYFANPKLQSKIAIVMLLTLNGFALHKYVLPLMQKAGSLLKLSFNQRMFALFTGAVSGVSWFYAAMLGIGRPLNWKYSLLEILAAYPVLIVGGFASMVLLTAWSQRKSSATCWKSGTPTTRASAAQRSTTAPAT